VKANRTGGGAGARGLGLAAASGGAAASRRPPPQARKVRPENSRASRGGKLFGIRNSKRIKKIAAWIEARPQHRLINTQRNPKNPSGFIR
jgi:hypothetical protein